MKNFILAMLILLPLCSPAQWPHMTETRKMLRDNRKEIKYRKFADLHARTLTMTNAECTIAGKDTVFTPLEYSSSVTFNKAGQKVSEVGEIGKIEYRYDAAGRLIRRSVEGSAWEEYWYDKAGRLIMEMTTEGDFDYRKVEYRYNAQGKLVGEKCYELIYESYRHYGDHGLRMDSVHECDYDYTFDKRGWPVSKRMVFPLENGADPVDVAQFTCDEKGNVVRVDVLDWEWPAYIIYSTDRLVTEEGYCIYPMQDNSSYHTTYNYVDGYLTGYTIETPDGKTESSEITDSSGNVVSFTWRGQKGAYQLSKDGLIEKVVYPGNGDARTAEIYTYTYW